MTPSKVLCFMFLCAILGVDHGQNLEKYNRRIGVFIQLTNRNIVINKCNSCILYECKTKGVHSRGPSNTNLGLFVCSFDICWGLTMMKC